jgi:hypothetical protein
VDVIRHDADGIQLKLVFLYCLFDGIEKDFPTFEPLQFKFSIIATDCYMVSISSLEATKFSWHRIRNIPTTLEIHQDVEVALQTTQKYGLPEILHQPAKPPGVQTPG